MSYMQESYTSQELSSWHTARLDNEFKIWSEIVSNIRQELNGEINKWVLNDKNEPTLFVPNFDRLQTQLELAEANTKSLSKELTVRALNKLYAKA